MLLRIGFVCGVNRFAKKQTEKRRQVFVFIGFLPQFLNGNVNIQKNHLWILEQSWRNALEPPSAVPRGGKVIKDEDLGNTGDLIVGVIVGFGGGSLLYSVPRATTGDASTGLDIVAVLANWSAVVWTEKSSKSSAA